MTVPARFNPASLDCAGASHTFSSFGSNTDLTTFTPTNAPGPTGAACRLIVINSVGASPTLAVQYEDGTTDTIPVAVGQEIKGCIVAILSSGTSNVTSCTVFW